MRQLKITLLLLTLLTCIGIRVQQTAQAQIQRGGKFPHGQAGNKGQQGHRDLACANCHMSNAQAPFDTIGKPTPGIKANNYSPFPGHASCVSCHNFAQMFFAKPNFCGICHETKAVSEAQPGLFARLQTPRAVSDFGTAFSHVSHRQALPTDLNVLPSLQGATRTQFVAGQTPACTACHTPLPQAGRNTQEFTVEAGHATCFTCHLDRPVTAKAAFPARQDCAGCHQLPLADGRKQLSPQLFTTAKVLDFWHREHEFDTRPSKKGSARATKPRDALCVECHQAAVNAQTLNDIKAPGFNECASCHNDRRYPGLPEPLRQAVRQTLR